MSTPLQYTAVHCSHRSAVNCSHTDIDPFSSLHCSHTDIHLWLLYNSVQWNEIHKTHDKLMTTIHQVHIRTCQASLPILDNWTPYKETYTDGINSTAIIEIDQKRPYSKAIQWNATWCAIHWDGWTFHKQSSRYKIWPQNINAAGAVQLKLLSPASRGILIMFQQKCPQLFDMESWGHPW